MIDSIVFVGTLYGIMVEEMTLGHLEDGGELLEEPKGIMAGVPVSAFLANFYLRELDEYFYERHIPYIRYSDDILVFAKDDRELCPTRSGPSSAFPIIGV